MIPMVLFTLGYSQLLLLVKRVHNYLLKKLKNDKIEEVKNYKKE